MLEKLKAQVLLAYLELNRYGLDKQANGTVSAIDRERGMIVMKSARDAVVVDVEGNVVEGTKAPSADIQSHIAIYQAFPKLGGIVQPHAKFTAFFAQAGMDIPALTAQDTDCFRVEIPCAASAAEVGEIFRRRNIDPLRTPAALVTSCSAYAWGETALDAVTNAAALEKTAHMANHTLRLSAGIRSAR